MWSFTSDSVTRLHGIATLIRREFDFSPEAPTVTLARRVGPGCWYFSRTEPGSTAARHFVSPDEPTALHGRLSTATERAFFDEGACAAEMGCDRIQVIHVALTPDGLSALVLTDLTGSRMRLALHEVDVLTGERRCVAAGRLGQDVVWSKSHDRYVLAQCGSGRHWTVERRTFRGGESRVVLERHSVSGGEVRLSVAGSHVLVEYTDNRGPSVIALDSESLKQVASVQFPAACHLVATADQERLVVASGDRDGRCRIWVAAGAHGRAIGLDWSLPSFTPALIRPTVSGLVLAGRNSGLPTVAFLARTDGGYAPPRILRRTHEQESVWLDRDTSGSSEIRLRAESFSTPRSTWSVDPAAGTWNLLGRHDVPGYEPGKFVATRVFAPASDGADVPITLLRARDVEPTGINAGVVTAYGAYGVAMTPRFAAHRLPVLRRGGVYAVVHARGGGEGGPAWHAQGARELKIRGILDLIDSIRFLVDTGWLAADRIGAEAGSAGGLLVAAAMNIDPRLLSAVTLTSPFVAPLATLSDPAAPFRAEEIAELGDPSDPAIRSALEHYDPSANVRAGVSYPALFVVAFSDDEKVPAAAVCRWFKAVNQADADAVRRPYRSLQIAPGSHSGPPTRALSRLLWSYQKAFLLTELRMAASEVRQP